MNIKAKKAILENARIKYADVLSGVKGQRVHISIEFDTRTVIAKESAAMNITNVEYIILSALAFDGGFDTMLCRLVNISGKLTKYMRTNNIEYKGVNTSKKEISEMGKTKVGRPSAVVEKESVHIRLTKQTSNILKEKAAVMGLSLSDYVEFVVANFDLMALTDTINEINNKLDVVLDEKAR